RNHQRDSQSSRFSDGRRRRPAARSRRSRPAIPGYLLQATRRRLSSPSRPPANHSRQCGLPMFPPARRVLHNDGHFRLQFSQRHRIRKISSEGNRRSSSARLKLLQRSKRRQPTSTLHLLQNAKNSKRRSRAPSEAKVAPASDDPHGNQEPQKPAGPNPYIRPTSALC